MRLFATLGNFVAGLLYACFTLAFFIAISAASVATPPIVGALLFEAMRHLPGGQRSSLVILPVVGGLAASLGILVGSVRAVSIVFKSPDPGVTNDSPAVAQVVGSVAALLRMSPFRVCYIDDGVGAYTYFTARGKYVVLGAHAMRHLSALELEAVMAHEYAHHLQQAMAVNRVHYWTQRAFQGYMVAHQQAIRAFVTRGANVGNGFAYIWQFAGISMLANLLYMFVFGAYLRAGGKLLRQRDYEYYCDSIAIDAVGGRHLAHALDKLSDLSHALHAVPPASAIDAAAEAPVLVRICETIDRHFEELRRVPSSERLTSRSVGSDTHPPLQVRIDRAGGLGPTPPDAAVWTVDECVKALHRLGLARAARRGTVD